MHLAITENQKETEKLAGELAKKLTQIKRGKALVVALAGELGSGKTTFVKGFSKALGMREKVLSPTFVLIHRHKLTINKKRSFFINSYKNLFHIDAYRLGSAKDLLKLGVKEIFAGPENIVMIEWADKVKRIVPKNATWVYLKHSDKNKRSITEHTADITAVPH